MIFNCYALQNVNTFYQLRIHSQIHLYEGLEKETDLDDQPLHLQTGDHPHSSLTHGYTSIRLGSITVPLLILLLDHCEGEELKIEREPGK